LQTTFDSDIHQNVVAFTFRPALFAGLKDYNRADFLKDLGAGITVGVIALPLAIGFAIASGVSPQQGLWTAIIAGAVVAAFGGSKFQIAGPTGAFVPVLAAIVAQNGYEGLAIATLMAGVMLILMGIFKLGALLRFIPYPVIAGFTTGIATIIFIGQLNEGLGLGLKMPAHIPQQLLTLGGHLSGLNWHAVAICGLAVLIQFQLPRLTKLIPPSIAAVLLTTVLALILKWPVPTVASKFGAIPAGLPGWHFPPVSLEVMRELMAAAFTIAALGAIESLLSASVADGMADTRHDSNQELIGQGIANLLCPLAGGIAATGAIARTAANIRNGARSPVSGLVHSLFLLLVALIAAPYAGYIPLAALSGILITVAVRMAEWEDFHSLWKSHRSDFFVMLAAFLLTVIFDLTIGVGAGLLMALVMFVRRMEEISHIHLLTPENDPETDGSFSLRGKTVPPGVVLFRFHGPMFFAAADKLETALRGSGGKPRVVILRMRYVPSMDATAVQVFRSAVEKLLDDGVTVYVTGIQAQPMSSLFKSGVVDLIKIENFCGNLDEALQKSRQVPAIPAVA
jgi:SulP family sulfate permease